MQVRSLSLLVITARAIPMRPLTETEIEPLIQSLPRWRREDKMILRDFCAETVTEAAAMVPRLAVYAEKMNHHPEVLWVYNRLRIGFTTHDVDGLTATDFRMAAYIEEWLHD